MSAVEAASVSPIMSAGSDEHGQPLEHDDIDIDEQAQLSSRSNRFSIDESLELERQLDSESLPTTPAYNQASHGHHSQGSSSAEQIGQLLDPSVLAHIIVELRRSLKEVTAERDAMRGNASNEIEGELARTRERCNELEDQLASARKKAEDDENAIQMLRTKVEESRRGLMRLQTENRRQSQAPGTLDLSRASAFSFGGGTPKSSKRQSFTPLTGTLNSASHRKIASIETQSPTGPTFEINAPSPNGQTISFPDNSPPTASRRLSGMFGGGGAGATGGRRSLSPDASDSNLANEVEGLRKEVKTLKDALDETRAELSEATEARDASDACATALREFIDMNNVGAVESSSSTQTIRASDIPPGPPPKAAPAPAPAAQGWGIGRLFRQGSVSLDTSSVPAATSASSPTSTASPSTAQPQPQSAAAPPPLSKKIGSFFGSRASVSSTASSITPPSNTLQSNAASTTGTKRESTYSFSTSETSSMGPAEPISPTIDEEEDDNVKVREASGSDSGSPRTGESEAMGKTPTVDNPTSVVAA